jgi:hypothetical protein
MLFLYNNQNKRMRNGDTNIMAIIPIKNADSDMI